MGPSVIAGLKFDGFDEFMGLLKTCGKPMTVLSCWFMLLYRIERDTGIITASADDLAKLVERKRSDAAYALAYLARAGILVRVGRGQYEVNPHIIWLGSEESRERAKQAYAGKREAEEARQAAGMVYVIGSDGGLTKIGFSRAPAKRIRALLNDTGYKNPRVAIYSHADAWRLEKEAHRLFQAHRRDGEWFDVPFQEAGLGVESLGGVLVQSP
jgi:hypothetical protein